MRISPYKFTAAFTFVLLLAAFVFGQSEREQGIELYRNGDYQKAAETLQKALESNKNDQDSWLYFGMSLVRLNKQNKAAAAFEVADKTTPNEVSGSDKKVKLTAKPRANYTDAARQGQISGTVKLAVEFGADGTIKAIFPFSGLPYGLTEETVKAAKKMKFETAMKDGKPVNEVRIIKYSFQIY